MLSLQLAIVALAAVANAQQQYQKPIAILRQSQDFSPEGSYSYGYETENGISQTETGAPSAQGETGPVVTNQGSYSYTAPDGTPIQVTYVADENGFRAQGAHLPVAPPVPEAILRSLEYIRTHPQPEQQQQQQFNRRF